MDTDQELRVSLRSAVLDIFVFSSHYTGAFILYDLATVKNAVSCVIGEIRGEGIHRLRFLLDPYYSGASTSSIWGVALLETLEKAESEFPFPLLAVS